MRHYAVFFDVPSEPYVCSQMEKCQRRVTVLYALKQQSTKVGVILWAACQECFEKVPHQNILLTIQLESVENEKTTME